MSLAKELDVAVRDALAAVRAADADAGAELAERRRTQLTRPTIVIVGETKRGKSSLLNALLGVPDLSPVDAAVATAAYLHFSPGTPASAAAYVPGAPEPVPVDVARLADWATGGEPPGGGRAPRRIEVTHPAPLLQYLSLLDTPGVGGLDPAHTAVALDAVERATALLFVADASAPLSQPELDFLAAASERVDAVVFALTKIDAFPGWRRIAEDNRALLRARAPRFADAPWFPVSARLAELALGMPAGEQAALVGAARIAELQHALVELAGRGHQLQLANVLRTARGDLARLEAAAEARLRACDADPAEVARVRAQRSALAARKRTESRQWALLLSAETQRARVEVVGLLRTRIAAVQLQFGARIDAARGEALAALPDQVDAELQAVAVRLSDDLRATFRQVGERVLAQVFDDEELAAVLDRLNATLRHALAERPGARRLGRQHADRAVGRRDRVHGRPRRGPGRLGVRHRLRRRRRAADSGRRAGPWPGRGRLRAVPPAGAVRPPAGPRLAARGAGRGPRGPVRRDLLPVHRPAVRAGRGRRRRGRAAAARTRRAHRGHRRGGGRGRRGPGPAPGRGQRGPGSASAHRSGSSTTYSRGRAR
nr:hypothetical protein GCM10020092_057380 [Actinoplanes digitatis]